jgi:cbb3-type cytochrome oxidase cytochrome c subunit
MPATDETYRRQPTLHLVFAISSIAMLLATVWMVMADHLRPWKQVQREFQLIEREKLNASEKEKQNELDTKYKSQLDEISSKIEAANKSADEQYGQIRGLDSQISKLDATAEGLDMERRFKKTELDSKRSLYDGMIDRAEEGKARVYLSTDVADAEKELIDRAKKLEVAQAELKVKKDKRDELKGHVADLEKEKEKLTREADRVKGLIASKDALYGGPLNWYSKPMAFLRSLPGIDIAPPTKIQQLSLPELTINYNFKEVPRYDRCQTCHQGIDRTGYEKDAAGNEMPSVFKSHPFLSTGATTIDPRGKLVEAGLYLDGNGPHPMNSFGCTICHGGQGSGTDFTFASHSADSPEQAEEWTKKHGWQNFHFWDFPMLPDRFIESGCLKCHTQITDIPQAKKLQAGYQRITKYGCTGCHTIGGEGSIGPDLSDERQVGPNLSHIAAKDAKEWVVKWIANPHAFRPDSRMPRFYGLGNNNSAKEDWPKNYAEIYAITHYLYTKSTPPADFTEPSAKTDPAKGKELFLQKGCLACHQHRPYAEADIQLFDKGSINRAYKLDPAATFDPQNFPEKVRENALADFGPNLSNIAAKFAGKPAGQRWLTNWIQAPERYHPKSLMPNLQLTPQDAADIASWLLSVPGEWPVTMDVPALDSKEVKVAVDELVKLYVTKSGSFKTADGKSVTKSLSEVDEFVTKLKTEDKLLYLGEKSISRLGCFGCHTIPGFENAKPIGTALNDWGIKNPARLDFGHIAEYLTDQDTDLHGTRDGTDTFYQEKIRHETRMGFLYQKLHRPRSYDYLKKSERYKAWDDRLRMPQFAWANDPKAIEEVMTFVLGLTSEKVAARYLPATRTTAARTAIAEGSKVLNRFNCAGCHVLEMPRFTIKTGTLAEAMPNFKGNLRSSYSARNNDYEHLNPGLTFDAAKKLDPGDIEKELGVSADDGKPVMIEGMPIDLFDNELTVQIWKPVTIRGYTFSVGDNVTLDDRIVAKTPAVGGDFPFLFAEYQRARTGTAIDAFWNRLPPPLLLEGLKVQTPWLTSFLHDPRMIRPAVQLRMPRFHFGKDDKSPSTETDTLANFFAARDRAQFPYQSIPEQNPSYLAERDKAFPGYLGAGWTMMTNKASPCLQCHAIGQFKPSGGEAVVNGPDLREVATRFRPEYLEAWLANPRRMLPFTAMPQNIAPRGDVQIQVPKTFEKKPIDMVRAVRDTLLNYVNAVELQLASSSSGTTPEAAPSGAPSKPSANAP